jgi:hypothetical protein
MRDNLELDASLFVDKFNALRPGYPDAISAMAPSTSKML